MMKKIKKLIFVITLFVAGIAFTCNAFAFPSSNNGVLDGNGKKIDVLQNAVMYDQRDEQGNKNDGTYTLYNHYLDFGSDHYSAYCLDGVRRTLDKGSYGSYHVIQELDPENNGADRVIANILNSDASYNAKVLAMRAFLPYTTYIEYNISFTTEAANDVYEIYANYNSGMLWGSEVLSELKTLIPSAYGASDADDLYEIFLKNNLNNSTFKHYKWRGANGNKLNVDDNSTVAEAKTLFLESIKKAAKSSAKTSFITKEEVKKNVSIKNFYKDPETIKLSDRDGKTTMYAHDVQFEVTFTGFNQEGSNNDVFLDLTFDTYNLVFGSKAQYKFLDDSTDTWTEFDKNTNFGSPDIIKGKNQVTIVVKLRVAGYYGKEVPTNAHLSVNGSYYTENYSGVALVGTNNITTVQRFFISESAGDDYSPSSIDESFDLNWENEPLTPPPGSYEYCTSPDEATLKDPVKLAEFIANCCFPSEDNRNFDLVNACETETDETKKELYCTLKNQYCDHCKAEASGATACTGVSATEFVGEGKLEVKDDDELNISENLGVSIHESDDIDVCLLGDIYDSNKVASTADNQFCTVYCKEDFDISMPTAAYVISGKYMSLATKVNARKSCYSSAIDYDAFYKKMDAANNVITAYKSGAGTKDSANEALDQINSYIKDMNECMGGWDTTKDGKTTKVPYDYDPTIKFTYPEEYLDLYNSDSLKFTRNADESNQQSFVVGCSELTDTEVDYGSNVKTACKVDSRYLNDLKNKLDADKSLKEKENISAVSDTINVNVGGGKIQYYTCDNVSDVSTCKENDFYINPNNKYYNKVTNASDWFTLDNAFYTKYSTGVIVAGSEEKDPNKTFRASLPTTVVSDDNGYCKKDACFAYTKLESDFSKKFEGLTKPVNDLPVSLKTAGVTSMREFNDPTSGIYNYYFNFSNLGTNFSGNSNKGRLDQYLTVKNVAKDKNGKDKNGVDLSNFNVNYVCAYVVNCPDCAIGCKDDPENGFFCELDFDYTNYKCDKGAECPLYDGDLNVSYRSFSAVNFGSIENLGDNFMTGDKGKSAMEEITKKGESIYDEPEYSFKFTPALIQLVKSTNDKKSSYLDDDLYCKEYTTEYNGKPMSYSVCRSSLLDELKKEGNKGDVKVVLNGRALTKDFLTYCNEKNKACALIGQGPAWK